MTQLTLEETAERVGAYVWIEARLFEILGGWVQVVPEPEAKEFLAEQSQHHAWHMELWRERLPRLREMDVVALVRPFDPAIESLMEKLRNPMNQDSTVVKLSGVYRVVLPWLVGAYSRHRARCARAADRPIERVLDLVVADELEDRRRAEMLIQTLVHGAPDPTEAVKNLHYHAVTLETILAEMAGIVRHDV